MCAMALMHARFKRVVFAAADPKTGVAGSVTDLFGLRQLNHHTRIEGGLLSEASSRLLKSFFAERRAQIRAERDARRAAEVASGGMVLQSGVEAPALLTGLDVIEDAALPERGDNGLPLPLPLPRQGV